MKTLSLALLTLSVLPGTLRAADPVPDIAEGPKGKPLEVTSTAVQEGEEKTWQVDSTYRSQYIFPSNYGEAGIFHLRSAESLPEGALTFGIGGEYYSSTNVNFLPGTSANTIAEGIFVGYSPVRNLTVAVQRSNSSTTFTLPGPGQPTQLISSLGDFNLSTMYSFPLSPTFAVAPILDVTIASDFNALSPSGRTVSAGFGGAATYSLFPATGAPVFLHANLIYHSPMVTSGFSNPPQNFYNFSRFNTLTLGLGAEYQVGDFSPFLELRQIYHHNSFISWGNSPMSLALGTRITPLANRSLAVLLGGEAGLSRSFAPFGGVPYTPAFQFIGQVSYTVGVMTTERKHYRTTSDVNVVDRKFVLKKNVNFKVASAELDPASAGLLDQIAEVIKQNNVKKLLIVGHTDSSHGEDYNLKLSLDRANSVKRYLVGRGIPEDTLMTQGYGKRRPKASNLTEAGRQINRRVEFLIVD